jgi:hypothetical protein
MKKLLFVVMSFVVGCATLTCSPTSIEPVIEQTVFDNFTSCCDTSVANPDQARCKTFIPTQFILKNLTGVIFANEHYGPDVIYIGLEQAYNLGVDRHKYLAWYQQGGRLIACNLPPSLKKTSTDVNVKFDVNVYYEPPYRSGDPDGSNGHIFELIRLEVLK